MFTLIWITCLAHFGDDDVSSAECTILLFHTCFYGVTQVLHMAHR